MAPLGLLSWPPQWPDPQWPDLMQRKEVGDGAQGHRAGRASFPRPRAQEQELSALVCFPGPCCLPLALSWVAWRVRAEERLGRGSQEEVASCGLCQKDTAASSSSTFSGGNVPSGRFGPGMALSLGHHEGTAPTVPGTAEPSLPHRPEGTISQLWSKS